MDARVELERVRVELERARAELERARAELAALAAGLERDRAESRELGIELAFAPGRVGAGGKRAGRRPGKPDQKGEGDTRQGDV